MVRIAIILGSTRPGRKGEAVAQWVLEHARKHSGAEVELVDLKDFNLPLLDEPKPPRLYWPQTRVFLLSGLILGLVLGVLLAFARDFLDDSLKTVEDVERYLRNSKAAVIYEGTSQLHTLIQADYALGYREDRRGAIDQHQAGIQRTGGGAEDLGQPRSGLHRVGDRAQRIQAT